MDIQYSFFFISLNHFESYSESIPLICQSLTLRLPYETTFTSFYEKCIVFYSPQFFLLQHMIDNFRHKIQEMFLGSDHQELFRQWPLQIVIIVNLNVNFTIQDIQFNMILTQFIRNCLSWVTCINLPSCDKILTLFTKITFFSSPLRSS